MPSICMDFEGAQRVLALPGATWEQVTGAAQELSGLEECDLRYEDEEGYLRRLGPESMADLLWVAEASVPPVKLLVRKHQDNADAVDWSLDLLREHCQAGPKQEDCAPEPSEKGCDVVEEKPAGLMAVCQRRRKKASGDAALLSDLVRHMVSQMF